MIAIKPGHRYLFEYPDRPLLDLGYFPPTPPPQKRKEYRCPKCMSAALTPKRCRACNVKMTRCKR